MKIRKNFTCPLELTHDMIKGKWKPIIIWRLRDGKTSLSQLEKEINGITQKMLLQHLKELIDYGFVEKNQFSGYPLKVEYFLTDDRGQKILEALIIMQKLGLDYMLQNNMEKQLCPTNIVVDAENNNYLLTKNIFTK